MMNFKNVRLLAFLLAVLALVGPAQAKTAKPADPAPAGPDMSLMAPSPDAINTLRLFKSQGAQVTYLGRQFGIDGWMVVKDKVVQVVYTTLDGQGTIVGVLYGPQGEMETSKQLIVAQQNGAVIPGANTADDITGPAKTPATSGSTNEAIAPSQPAVATAPDKPVPASERLMKEVENATYLKFGPDTAPPLYVFMDPRCHFCHDYWQTLGQYLLQNNVQVRVIPVAVLGDDSVQQAERIISAPDPGAAWSKIEQGDLSVLVMPPAPDSPQRIQYNNNIMVHWKMNGTPYSVYRSKEGKVKLVYAVPTDVGQVVNDLGK